MLLDQETAPDISKDSMYTSLLSVMPVVREDSDRWGFL